MIEYISDIPFYIWLIAAIMLPMFFLDGISKGITFIFFILALGIAFVGFPLYYAEYFESSYGFLFGLAIGLFFWISINVITSGIKSKLDTIR
jgi:hypothetical protein